MDTSWIQLRFLFGLLLSGLCGRLCFALLPVRSMLNAPLQSPLPQQSQVPSHSLAQEQVNTVSVICHPDSLEVVIQADMFAVGAPVDNNELRLGVVHNEFCVATVSGDVYRILVGLEDCGTRHWMTEDSLVYTNLLIYSPTASPDGIIRMDEAVIPIECHYQRKYSLSSSSFRPTWIPFTSTQATVETLQFDLRIMTDDWNYERATNVFYLGESIKMEASVRVGHHTGLRVFLSSCVATLDPDIHSDPKYLFIDDGCLVDSRLPDSKAHFLPRTLDEKLQLVIDSFNFHNDDRGDLYITCHLNAAPVTDTEAPNKACTFMNGRWRSADGNDYLCGYCEKPNEAVKSLPGSFGPRGFGTPAEFEPMWRSGLKSSKVWDHEARLGPVTVLPSRKIGPLPAEQLPPVLLKVHRPALYGSEWRSGLNLPKGLLPGLAIPEDDGLTIDDDDDDDEENEDDDNETAPKGDKADFEDYHPGFDAKAEMDGNTTAPSDFSITSQFEEGATNETATESYLSDPKK